MHRNQNFETYIFQVVHIMMKIASFCDIIHFKYDEKRYLSQLVSEVLISTTCAPQYELNSSVTMATYWAPGIPHINV